MYGGLARRLGPDQPIYGLQSPGLNDGESPLDSVEKMARLYLEMIQEKRPDGPYHLVGYCLGAVIAWEVAHQIEAKGGEVGILAMVSHDAQLRPSREWQSGRSGHLHALQQLQPGLWPAYFERRLRYRLRRLSCGTGELPGLYYQWSKRPLLQILAKELEKILSDERFSRAAGSAPALKGSVL